MGPGWYGVLTWRQHEAWLEQIGMKRIDLSTLPEDFPKPLTQEDIDHIQTEMGRWNRSLASQVPPQGRSIQRG